MPRCQAKQPKSGGARRARRAGSGPGRRARGAGPADLLRAEEAPAALGGRPGGAAGGAVGRAESYVFSKSKLERMFFNLKFFQNGFLIFFLEFRKQFLKMHKYSLRNLRKFEKNVGYLIFAVKFAEIRGNFH